MANEDVIERAEHTVRVLERMGPNMVEPHHAERVRELIAALREAREDTKRLFQALDDATDLISLAEHAWDNDDYEKAGRVHDVFRSFYAAMKPPGGGGGVDGHSIVS